MSQTVSNSAPTMRSFFANRFVQSIMLSGLFLQIGIWIRNFAILLYVTDMTNNDPYSVSLISVAEFAPIFIFSFIGGAFADRWRPKLTMVWCDILSAASVFVIMVTLYYGSWKAIFFSTLVSSILSQFSQPSGMKLFKVHVH
jgi:DHA3 family macrolide efflux protein-like MFS transporter